MAIPDKLIEEPTLLVIYICTLGVVGLLTFLINLAVLLVIINHHYLHLPSNMYLASMALANALLGLVGLPLAVLSSFNEKFNLSTCLCINSIYVMLSNLSVIMLMGFTIDRLFAVRWPYRYHSNVQCKQAIITIGILWSFGIIFLFMPTMMINQTQINNYKGVCNYPAVITINYVRYYRFIATFSVPIFIMIIINVYVTCIVRRHRKVIHRESIIPGRVLKRDQRAEKMLLLMIFTFTICGLPLNIVEAAWFQTDSKIRIDYHVHRLVSLLYYLHALFNPMIYGYNYTRIRLAIKNMILCSRKKDDLATSGTSSKKNSSKSNSKNNSSRLSAINQTISSYQHHQQHQEQRHHQPPNQHQQQDMEVSAAPVSHVAADVLVNKQSTVPQQDTHVSGVNTAAAPPISDPIADNSQPQQTKPPTTATPPVTVQPTTPSASQTGSQ